MQQPIETPLPGFKPSKPVVFVDFPVDSSEYQKLRQLAKLN